MADNRLEELLAQSEGFGIVDILDAAGIDQEEQKDIRRRMFAELVRMNRLEIGERMIAGDVLDDDQVVTVVGVFLRELVAAIGHLRPVTVKLNHYSELIEVPPAPAQQPTILFSGHAAVGAE